MDHGETWQVKAPVNPHCPTLLPISATLLPPHLQPCVLFHSATKGSKNTLPSALYNAKNATSHIDISVLGIFPNSWLGKEVGKCRPTDFHISFLMCPIRLLLHLPIRPAVSHYHGYLATMPPPPHSQRPLSQRDKGSGEDWVSKLVLGILRHTNS